MINRIEKYGGTTRITNPITLQRWIDNGKYKELIEDGYKFGIGCGRFVIDGCTCTLCRNRPKQKLKNILIANRLI